MALATLAAGAGGGLFRSIIDPQAKLGISCTAGSWKGLAFNAITGLAAAWILASLLSGEENLAAGLLYGYVGSDILDSIAYIIRARPKRRTS